MFAVGEDDPDVFVLAFAFARSIAHRYFRYNGHHLRSVVDFGTRFLPACFDKLMGFGLVGTRADFAGLLGQVDGGSVGLRARFLRSALFFCIACVQDRR